MRFTHTHKPSGKPCSIVSLHAGDSVAVINLGQDCSNPFPRVDVCDLEPITSAALTGPVDPEDAKPGDTVWVVSEGVIDKHNAPAMEATVVTSGVHGIAVSYGNTAYMGWGRDGVFWDKASATKAGRELCAGMVREEQERHNRRRNHLIDVLLKD